MPKLPSTAEEWDSLRCQFIRNNLRRVSLRWPAVAEARKKARLWRRINPATGRLAWRALCGECFGEFLERELEADHISPVVPVDRDYFDAAYSGKQLGEVVRRLLPDPLGYAMLCKPCHRQKTSVENALRRSINRKTRI